MVLIFLFLSPHYQICRVIGIWNNIKFLDLVWCLVIRHWKKIKLLDLMLLMFLFLFYHPTIRAAMLLEFETLSSCWTWYGNDVFFLFFSARYQIRRVNRIWNNIKLLDLVWYCFFFCIFNITEQWESPCYQTLKLYQVAGLCMVACYQTLKQYQVAGLGMLLMFLFLFYQPTIRVAVLLEFETISSCWIWYATDIYFPFLSPHYQSRYVIRIWNNIQLLDLVWYRCFSAFLTSPNNESRLVIRH